MSGFTCSPYTQCPVIKLLQVAGSITGCVSLQLDHNQAANSLHTIRKCKKMAGQNTFNFFLLNDAYMIGEHKETRMKMPNMCPMRKGTF